MELSSTAIQKALIQRLVRYPALLNYAQKIRYVLYKGPLQSHFVRYYQKHSARTSIELSTPSIFPAFDVNHVLRELNENGFAKAFELSAEHLSAILDCQKTLKSDHVHQAHKKCECLDRIVRDPKVVQVVRQYIGAEPIIYASSIYLTGPKPNSNEPPPEPKKIIKDVHFDANDFRDLNLFIYLTQVDEETSPHFYIEGTHRKKRFRDLVTRWYTRTEMQQRFMSRIKPVTGPAGTAFFEDTSVFHIQSVGKRGRYTVAVCYTLQRTPELARYHV